MKGGTIKAKVQVEQRTPTHLNSEDSDEWRDAGVGTWRL
jgi:hypothetical protein